MMPKQCYCPRCGWRGELPHPDNCPRCGLRDVPLWEDSPWALLAGIELELQGEPEYADDDDDEREYPGDKPEPTDGGEYDVPYLDYDGHPL